MIWVRHVARVRERRRVYRILVRGKQRRRPLENPSRRWEDNIKMNLQEVGCEGMDLVYVT
jgi:hypothetical protein